MRKNSWVLFVQRFQLDAVIGQVDADAATWGRNKAARGHGWKKGWGKKPTTFRCPGWNWYLALGKDHVLVLVAGTVDL